MQFLRALPKRISSLLVLSLIASAVPAQMQAALRTRCSAQGVVWQGIPLDAYCVDVQYGPYDCNRLDLYIPAAPTPRPVLVEFHRGGLHTGRKSDFGNYLQTGGTDGIVEKALRSGFAVVSVNYRLTAVTDGRCYNVLDPLGAEIQDPANAFPAANEDIARAVQFVRQMARTGAWNVDPDRIACLGGSGGGLLASWLAVAADRRNPLAPPGTVEAESSRVQCALVYRGPTDLRTGTNYICPTMTDLLWYFGTNSIDAYNNDPAIIAMRQQASPTWIAEQPGGPSAGYAAAAQIAYLGIYVGDPSITLSDFVQHPIDCTSPLDPLWIPTWDLHGILQGLRMQRTLTLLGNTRAKMVLRPNTGVCSAWNNLGTDEVVDYLCAALQQTPHDDLTTTYAGKAGSNGLVPRLSAYGKHTSSGQVVLWLKDAAAGRPVTLYVSANQAPTPFQGGILVPDANALSFTPLGVTSNCGHARITLPPTFTTPVYVQAVVDDPAASFGTALSNPIRVH